jgi:hypothetical protein
MTLSAVVGATPLTQVVPADHYHWQHLLLLLHLQVDKTTKLIQIETTSSY